MDLQATIAVLGAVGLALWCLGGMTRAGAHLPRKGEHDDLRDG